MSSRPARAGSSGPARPLVSRAAWTVPRSTGTWPDASRRPHTCREGARRSCLRDSVRRPFSETGALPPPPTVCRPLAQLLSRILDLRPTPTGEPLYAVEGSAEHSGKAHPHRQAPPPGLLLPHRTFGSRTAAPTLWLVFLEGVLGGRTDVLGILKRRILPCTVHTCLPRLLRGKQGRTLYVGSANSVSTWMSLILLFTLVR